MTKGIDVHGRKAIKWPRSAARFEFAFLKATEGRTFDDERFAFNRRAAKAAGLAVGGYHFARPTTTPPRRRRLTSCASARWSRATCFRFSTGSILQRPLTGRSSSCGCRNGNRSTADPLHVPRLPPANGLARGTLAVPALVRILWPQRWQRPPSTHPLSSGSSCISSHRAGVCQESEATSISASSSSTRSSHSSASAASAGRRIRAVRGRSSRLRRHVPRRGRPRVTREASTWIEAVRAEGGHGRIAPHVATRDLPDDAVPAEADVEPPKPEGDGTAGELGRDLSRRERQRPADSLEPQLQACAAGSEPAGWRAGRRYARTVMALDRHREEHADDRPDGNEQPPQWHRPHTGKRLDGLDPFCHLPCAQARKLSLLCAPQSGPGTTPGERPPTHTRQPRRNGVSRSNVVLGQSAHPALRTSAEQLETSASKTSPASTPRATRGRGRSRSPATPRARARASALVRAEAEEPLGREDAAPTGLTAGDPLELAELLERVDPHVRVGADRKRDPAVLDSGRREEAVREVGLGRRAGADGRAALGEQSSSSPFACVAWTTVT